MVKPCCQFVQCCTDVPSFIGHSLDSRCAYRLTHTKDRKMNAKRISEARQRLSNEYQNLMKSIDRGRAAAEEITLVENTEDEGDLATRRHDRDVLYHLYENDFVRVRFIEAAMEAIERGRYGTCFRCD